MNLNRNYTLVNPATGAIHGESTLNNLAVAKWTGKFNDCVIIDPDGYIVPRTEWVEVLRKMGY
jgi:hypothetical protein